MLHLCTLWDEPGASFTPAGQIGSFKTPEPVSGVFGASAQPGGRAGGEGGVFHAPQDVASVAG